MELRRLPGSIAIAAVAAAISLAPPPLARAESLPDPTERVIGLGRVWAKVKFYHPYLAYKDIDWDAALVAAIPKAEAAKTPTEYRAAVQGLLAALKDPVTRPIDAPAPGTQPPPAETAACANLLASDCPGSPKKRLISRKPFVSISVAND